MRIDKYLAGRYGSRTKAAFAVDKGLVLVNGRQVNCSYDVKESDLLTFSEPKERFVSAGGYKLDKALKDFGFCVKDKVFADIGASTGGFTDCLFQNGARKVYCFDVGDSQLDRSLLSRNVVVVDRFNARNLNGYRFSDRLDGAVIDVSFISLTYILSSVAEALDDGAAVIALIKPQFECESKRVGKNGIVKDSARHEKVIGKIYDFAVGCRLSPVALTNAPIVKGKNMEYLMMLVKGETSVLPLKSLIEPVIL